MKKCFTTFSVMNKFLKSLSIQKTSNGFTLIELLVAILITSILITATGWGVVAITQNDKKAKAETDRRVELNRALDFISDEVRQAKPIATNASANLSTVASNFSSSGKTPVLTLQIPGVSQRVIYYIASSSSPWLGPNVISRWGPNFNSDGTYSNPTTPANWTYEPLADLIVNEGPASDPCNGWSLNPPLASIKGFYACVDPSGKIATVNLRGKLIDAYGNSLNPLEVSSKVFARPSNVSFTLGSSTAPSIGSGGTVTITQPSTAYFEVLGGSMYCTGKGEIPTTTTLKVTQGGTTTDTTVPSSTKTLNLSPAVGTKITVTGFADNSFCYGAPDRTFNSETDKNTQVWTLRNGDTPPPFAPHGTQPNIDAYLKNYLDANGKVKLAENQVIYLFELFTTTTTESTYDMQDLVVLATIVPKE
ncbi:hypothetical protein C7B80_14555 [Cyanosarcina cf. burmensis CCALA 770]|nr:hypothetical protein C7B80_14555 [Cyanosarcina cf. burmensis CCALA 770]